MESECIKIMSLSQRELDLITKIGECMSEYRQLLYDDGPTFYIGTARIDHSDEARDGDINEFSQATHVMQRMVMARGAQRNHPDFFPRRPAPIEDKWDEKKWLAGQIPPKNATYEWWTPAPLDSSPGPNYRWDGYVQEWLYVGSSI